VDVPERQLLVRGDRELLHPRVGSPQNASWQQGDFDGGSFSVIGVGGLAVGQAWRETAAQTGNQGGNIVGYFTQGISTTGVLTTTRWSTVDRASTRRSTLAPAAAAL